MTLHAPVTIHNPKGDVVPSKVEEAIGHAYDRVRAAQRANDIATAWRLPGSSVCLQSHSRLIAVRELDAGRFERAADGLFVVNPTEDP